MDRQSALVEIIKAVKAVVPDLDVEITESTDLLEDDVLDSLDSMNFLFELEESIGKISSINEDYSDFKVSALIDLLVK